MWCQTLKLLIVLLQALEQGRLLLSKVFTWLQRDALVSSAHYSHPHPTPCTFAQGKYLFHHWLKKKAFPKLGNVLRKIIQHTRVKIIELLCVYLQSSSFPTISSAPWSMWCCKNNQQATEKAAKHLQWADTLGSARLHDYEPPNKNNPYSRQCWVQEKKKKKTRPIFKAHFTHNMKF